MLFVIVGPFSDYGHYRRQLLVGCVFVWIPVFSAMFFVSNPDLYGIGLALTVAGTVAFVFGLKSPLASYLPLIINATREVVELEHKLHSEEKHEIPSPGSISIEMAHRHMMDRTPVAEGGLVSSPDLLLPSTSVASDDFATKDPTKPDAVPMYVEVASPTMHSVDSDASHPAGNLLLSGADYYPSDMHDTVQLMDEYQRLYEAVAGRTAIGESAFFIAGQFVCLMIQFGLLLWLSDEDDPKDTLGERSAVLVSTLWGAIFCYLGITRLKNRDGPPFPPGTIETDTHMSL